MSETLAFVRSGFSKIGLQKVPGTGDSSIRLTADRRSGHYVSFPSDRSHSLQYTFTDQADSSVDNVWVKVLEYFLNESPKYFQPHSGVHHWRADRVMTQSNLDQHTVRMFFSGLSFVTEPERLMRLVSLNEKFQREKRRYLHYLEGIPEEYVNKVFRHVSAWLITIPYKDLAIEITPDKSLFFDIRLSNDLILHFKVILTPDLKAFFALYKDAICFDNGIGSLNEIVNHLSKLNAGIPSAFIAK